MNERERHFGPPGKGFFGGVASAFGCRIEASGKQDRVGIGRAGFENEGVPAMRAA
uniref:Uncharacterized protein n=1 Tax=Streptomyces sp. NBC_00049 TaxID=2903617 RepID=A0AAU2JMC6_9ACTN